MKHITHLYGLIAVVSALVATNSFMPRAMAQGSLTQGLVAYYPFHGNANDMVGTNNGTVNGAVLTTNRFGVPNTAYSFNGTAYIELGAPSTLAFANNFTLSAWCLFSGGTSNPRIIDSQWETGYELLTSGTGATRQFQVGCGQLFSYFDTTSSYAQNVWWSVVFVFQSNVGYIYYGVI